MEQDKKRHLWLRRAFKPLLLRLAVMTVVLTTVFIAGIVHGRHTEEGNVTAITSDLISEQLRAVSQLATVEYHYTNMGKFENQVDFYGWKVPLTQKSFILSYDGVIRAGINASNIAVRVSGKSITVTLPHAQILSHEIDNKSLEIFNETTSIFNPITIRDYTGFSEDQKSKIESDAVSTGLLSEAEDRAQDSVKQLLALLPASGGYTIKIQITPTTSPS